MKNLNEKQKAVVRLYLSIELAKAAVIHKDEKLRSEIQNLYENPELINP